MNEQRNAYAREWRARNRDRVNEQQRERYRADPYKYGAQSRDAGLKMRFGITSEEYDILFAMQKGVCAICRQPETVKTKSGSVRRLAVDHDHDTGKPRGLLCYRCNTALGYVERNLIAIYDYLRVAGSWRVPAWP